MHSWHQSHPAFVIHDQQLRHHLGMTATRVGDSELHICIYVERDPFLSLETPTLLVLHLNVSTIYLPTYLSHPNTKYTIK